MEMLGGTKLLERYQVGQRKLEDETVIELVGPI